MKFTEALSYLCGDDRGAQVRRRAWLKGECVYFSLCFATGDLLVTRLEYGGAWSAWPLARHGEYKPTRSDIDAEDWEVEYVW